MRHLFPSNSGDTEQRASHSAVVQRPVFWIRTVYTGAQTVTEEQSLCHPAAVLRLGHRCLHLLLHAAGADPVCAGIHQRLCWFVRRALHRVRHCWRWRSGRLRGQDKELHRSHKDQHELKHSGLHRLLSGVSDATSETGYCHRQLPLRLLWFLRLPGGHGAVCGVFISCRRGHVRWAHLHIGAGSVNPLHRPPAGFNQTGH